MIAISSKFLKSKFKSINRNSIILFALSFLLISPRFIYSLPGLSLDPSYILALSYFSEYGFNFGNDIVFTYGPLNYLSTRLGINELHQNIYLVANVIIVGLTSYLSSRILSNSLENRNYYFSLIFIVSLIIFPIGYDLIFLLFLIYFASIIEFSRSSNLRFLIIAVFCAALSYYIKVNTGIILFLHLLASSVLFFILSSDKSTKLKLVLFPLFLLISMLCIVSPLLNVSDYNYLKYSFDIISGYNENNVLLPEKIDMLFLASTFFISFLIISSNALITYKQEKIKTLYIFLTTLFAAFILFKQSIVRADQAHVILFFTNIFILVVFSISTRTVFTRLLFVNTLLLFFLAALPFSWFFLKNKLHHPKFLVQHVPFSDYFNGISQKTKNAFNISAKARVLPNNFQKEIGNSSVDILPWEQTFLIYNNLNYCPRPVFQTYQAYTPTLDGLNSSFYNSVKSPQYLLFSNHSTDTRNPFWEETKTKLSICENYALIDSMTCDTSIYREFYTAETPPKILLLKRGEKKSKKLSLVKTEKFNLPDNAVIDIPLDDKIILLKLNIAQSLVGKIRGALFQPAVMEARLLINNVWTKKYRVSPSLFGEGVIINKAVFNTSDAANFFADKLSLIPNVQKIQFVYPEVSKYYSMPVDYTLNYYILKRNYLGE
jgi:hypothetical protein